MLKVGDKVVRNDGYSRGLVVAVLEDSTNLNPLHQVVIRQRRAGAKDTVVTRNLEGYTDSGFHQYQFVKDKKKVTAQKFFVHYTDQRGPQLYTANYNTEVERDSFLKRNVENITVRKLTTETITYEVDE